MKIRIPIPRLLSALFAAVCLGSTAAADTYTVTTTTTSGAGSLRQAITDANMHPNLNANTPDTIVFAIPTSDPNRNATTGVFTIASPGTLTISDPVVIDGYTQPGASANTLAVGDNAVILILLDNGTTCFDVATGSSTLRGLAITGFDVIAIFLEGGVGGGNTIEGNFIGTDPAGAVAQPNEIGIEIFNSPNNIIGGTTPAARNLLSGNQSEQLLISGDSATGNQVQGNYIGTNKDGDAVVTGAPNRCAGINIFDAAGNTIGGTTSGSGNLISGNSNEGILIGEDPSTPNITQNNIVQGNLIGTDASGTSAVSNGVGNIDGVAAVDIAGGSNNTIGGTAAGSRNIISGNVGPGIEEAVLVDGSGNIVQGNFIGVDVTGNAALGNSGPGILVQAGSNNLIGGTAAGDGNIIAFNNSGVEIRGPGITTTGNAVFSNAIFSNSPGLGLDLYTGFSPDGVTPNDDNDCDDDSGPNNFQNFPVLTSANSTTGSTDITGALDSDDGIMFRVEFFSNATCDSSGNGEGQTFIGATVVTTDGTCNATINFTAPIGNLRGQFITATATDPENDTSEFSACVQATGAAPTPTPTPTPSPTATPVNVQLLNISGRVVVQLGDKVSIGGFIITGGTGKRVILRAIGPSLSSAGVSGALQDPVLELHDSSATLLSNDNWRTGGQEAEIMENGLAPTDDRESAIVATLAPANYTAIIRGANNSSGVGLIEIYDLQSTTAGELGNLSVRANVLTDDNVLIDGLILRGGTPKRVLFRAIGPELQDKGVSGALSDPTLELHDGNGVLLASNDNWRDAPNAAEIEATGLAPTDDRESAILMTVVPDNYTAIVRGVNRTTGIALAEAYKLDE